MDGSEAAREEFVRGHGGECGNEGARPRRLRNGAGVNSGQRSGPVKQREGPLADGPASIRSKFQTGLSVLDRSFVPPNKPKGVLHVRHKARQSPLVVRRLIPCREPRRGLKSGRFRLRDW